MGCWIVLSHSTCFHSKVCKTFSNIIYFYIISCVTSIWVTIIAVHEKSILLPLLPATLLAMELPGVHSMLLMLCALLSMFPLLCRDKLVVPYMALYASSILLYLAPSGRRHIKKHLPRPMITFSIVMIHFVCSLIFHIIYLTIRPPKMFPYLFQAMIMNFCFSHLLGFTVYTNAKQWMLSRQFTSGDKEKKRDWFCVFWLCSSY